jgi:hypothetical protein
MTFPLEVKSYDSNLFEETKTNVIVQNAPENTRPEGNLFFLF